MPTYDYPRAALAVDCVIFGFDGKVLHVLLTQRTTPPFVGAWALPGTYLHENENLESAALRALESKAGLKNAFLEQLYTFGAPTRDPRERIVSVAYYALISTDRWQRTGKPAPGAAWFPVATRPDLAFDHESILTVALERLRAKVRYAPIGFELLPAKFTLGQLQSLYEAILGAPLDKRNFRKKILATGILERLDERTQGASHRPAQFYRFDSKAYKKFCQAGFNFEV
jgi:8-oxo-dGTP diphosphatase